MAWKGEIRLTAETPRERRRVAARYHLIEPIGRGGMGIVWRAHDELLDREVAVKEVRYADMLGESGQEDFNRRTKREARAAGRLTHPNVIVVHDVVEEDGKPWIVMQLVESRSLGRVLREDGPLPPARVAEIGLQVLDALRAAHAQGVLHRDVKPENVLLADDGRVVLTDFGIATLETETALTMTGIAGTPAFIPPERIKGGSAQRESDLWSLGATLYTAVEGRPPHDRGGALPTMHAVLNDEPETPVRAGRLTPVLEGLLRKDPELRMSAEEAARLLREASGGGAGRQAPPRTAVMPATSDEATAETDPGIAYRPQDPPVTGAKLGAAAPLPAAGPPAPAAHPAVPAPPAPRRPQEPRDARKPSPSPPAGTGPAPRDTSAPSRGPGPVAPAGRGTDEPPLPPLPRFAPAARRNPVPGTRPSPVSAFSPPALSPASSPAPPPFPPPDGPLPPLSAPPPAPGSWASLKRGLVILLPVLIVVGVVAGWLGMREGQADGDPSHRPSAPAEPAEKDGEKGKGETSPSPSEPEPSPSATPAASKDGSALPDGWHLHKDSNGFSVGLPKGWDVDKRSGQSVWFRGPDRVSYLLIQYTDSPGPDPKKDWQEQERYSRSRFSGYERIRIDKVDYMKKAADWEFTWNMSSGKARVINRGFVTKGGRGYAIYWHTRADEWEKNLGLFKGFTATFSSKK
ncbi:hypothetical protein GCM10017673_01000 [Streptosporangium violaceochromogenes]|nr:hypothetical protein GCM10017673_01000 [Streptosporangium violaceochromogenes]